MKERKKKAEEPRISISVELQDRKVYVSATSEEKAYEQYEKVMEDLDKRKDKEEGVGII